MSKYFVPYNTPDLKYPEDIKKIREMIEAKYGKLQCNDRKLDELWRDYSDEYYSAQFLIPNDENVAGFVDWLEDE